MGLLDPNLDVYYKKNCLILKKALFWAKILKILFEIMENVGRFFISFIELLKKTETA